MLKPNEIIEIGVTAKDENITYQEIGDTYGITRERVRQILTQHFPYIVIMRKASLNMQRKELKEKAKLINHSAKLKKRRTDSFIKKIWNKT